MLIFQRLLYYTLCCQIGLCGSVRIRARGTVGLDRFYSPGETKGMNKGTGEEEEKLYREGPVLCQELWEGERCYSCHKVEVRGLETAEWFSFGLFIKRRAGRPSYVAFSSRRCCKQGWNYSPGRSEQEKRSLWDSTPRPHSLGMFTSRDSRRSETGTIDYYNNRRKLFFYPSEITFSFTYEQSFE